MYLPSSVRLGLTPSSVLPTRRRRPTVRVSTRQVVEQGFSLVSGDARGSEEPQGCRPRGATQCPQETVLHCYRNEYLNEVTKDFQPYFGPVRRPLLPQVVQDTLHWRLQPYLLTLVQPEPPKGHFRCRLDTILDVVSTTPARGPSTRLGSGHLYRYYVTSAE